jgi:hypothetical protein
MMAELSQQKIICPLLQDVDAKPTASEALKKFPMLKLMLRPNGCAAYKLPVQPGQNALVINPAGRTGPSTTPTAPRGD